ncbi:MAG TPA: glutathione peroxidase, partial [Myxococcales bacterium]|nr:glutathione peroxidase [Myxococcales bacterium]
MTSKSSALDHVVKDAFGEDHDLKQYRGKAVLIVNVASRCGYTPQYKGLQELHKEYSARGLQVLGFPC